jgi:hypothetical protein
MRVVVVLFLYSATRPGPLFSLHASSQDDLHCLSDQSAQFRRRMSPGPLGSAHQRLK